MIEQGTPFAAIVAMVRSSAKTLAEVSKLPVLVMVSEVPLQAAPGFATLHAGPGFVTQHATDVESLAVRQTEALRQTPSCGLVFFLRKREAGVFTDKIGLGRTRNVDVFIPNSQISKYHAFFSLNGDDAWTITDADSKNGTRVGEERLVAGMAKALPSGKKVVVGGIEFIFYLPGEFVALCRNSAGSIAALGR